jgi:hypothetical protein
MLLSMLNANRLLGAGLVRAGLVAAGLAAGLMLAPTMLIAPAWAAVAQGVPPAMPATGPVLLAQAPAAAPGQTIEANIAQLHQRLQITPAQEPQFNALVAVMRQNAQIASAAPPANANAVETLRLAIQYGQEEVDGMKRLLPALQALYASLSPAQQKTADMVFRQGPGE